MGVEFLSGPIPMFTVKEKRHIGLYWSAVLTMVAGTLLIIATAITLSLHVTIGGFALVTILLFIIGATLLVVGYILTFVMEVRQ